MSSVCFLLSRLNLSCLFDSERVLAMIVVAIGKRKTLAGLLERVHYAVFPMNRHDKMLLQGDIPDSLSGETQSQVYWCHCASIFSLDFSVLCMYISAKIFFFNLDHYCKKKRSENYHPEIQP